MGAYHRPMEIRPFELERYYERWEFRGGADALEQRLRVARRRGAAGARARRARAPARAAPRLHRGGRIGRAARGGIAASTSASSPTTCSRVAAAEEGIFTRLPRAARPRRSRGGGGALLRRGDRGGAQHRRRGQPLAASPRGRLGHDLEALERMLRSDTRLIYVNSPHNPTGMAMAPADVRARWSRSPASARWCCSATRSTVGSSTTRSTRLPAACDRYERSDLAQHRLQGLWAAGAARRLAGVPRSRAARAHPRAEALHHDLLERAQRTAGGAGAAPRRAPDRAQPGGSCSPTCRWSTSSSPATPICSSGCVPTAGPIGFPRVGGEFDVHGWCERIAEHAGVLLLPGIGLRASRGTYAWASVARSLPQALERLEGYLA